MNERDAERGESVQVLTSLRLPDWLNLAGLVVAAFFVPWNLYYVVGGLSLAFFSGLYLLFYGRVRRTRIPFYMVLFTFLVTGCWIVVIAMAGLLSPSPLLFCLGSFAAPISVAPLWRLNRKLQSYPLLAFVAGVTLALLFGADYVLDSPQQWGMVSWYPYVWLSLGLLLVFVSQRGVRLKTRLALLCGVAIQIGWALYHVEVMLLVALPLVLLPVIGMWIGRVRHSIGRLSLWVVLVMAGLFTISYISHIVDDYFVLRTLPSGDVDAYTINGRPYDSLSLGGEYQSGYPVEQYICEAELRTAWGKASKLSYDSLDRAGAPVRLTAIRYLTSLGHRKDSVGMSFLNTGDIAAIESGVYNAHLRGRGPLYKYVWHELEGVERYLLGQRDTSTLLVRGGLALVQAWEKVKKNPWTNQKEIVWIYRQAAPSTYANLAVGVGWVFTAIITLLYIVFGVYAACRFKTPWRLGMMYMIAMCVVIGTGLQTIAMGMLMPTLYSLALHGRFSPSLSTTPQDKSEDLEAEVANG